MQCYKLKVRPLPFTYHLLLFTSNLFRKRRHRARIDSVCATLLESRYGPGRVSQLVVNLSDIPELEPAVFFRSVGQQRDGAVLGPVARGTQRVSGRRICIPKSEADVRSGNAAKCGRGPCRITFKSWSRVTLIAAGTRFCFLSPTATGMWDAHSFPLANADKPDL